MRSGPGLTRTGLRIAAHWPSTQRHRGEAKLIAVLGDGASRDGESVCAEPLRELSVAEWALLGNDQLPKRLLGQVPRGRNSEWAGRPATAITCTCPRPPG